MKMFTLYIGCANAFDAALPVIYPRFDSFTFQHGEGFFRGESEPVLLVRIATDDGAAVIAAAQELRARLNQFGIGIEYDGRYYRCRADDPAQALQQQLARENSPVEVAA